MSRSIPTIIALFVRDEFLMADRSLLEQFLAAPTALPSVLCMTDEFEAEKHDSENDESEGKAARRMCWQASVEVFFADLLQKFEDNEPEGNHRHRGAHRSQQRRVAAHGGLFERQFRSLRRKLAHDVSANQGRGSELFIHHALRGSSVRERLPTIIGIDLLRRTVLHNRHIDSDT